MGMFRGSNSEKSATKDSSEYDGPAGYTKPKPTLLRIFAASLYTIAVVFLILVMIGNVNDNPVIRSTYFLRIDLANIIPASVPNAIFINSIARSIGLHDFYQVGLWNFCEGYNGQGITRCSKTKTLYWFNPVDIILDELIAGASITLPSDVVKVLDLVKLASEWMFACFLVGTCLTFLCMFFGPLGFSKKPRWQHKAKRIFLRQLPITVLTFAALLLTAAASVIATVMFVIFRNQFRGAADLNIRAHLGKPMLAFMWIATGLNLIGFIMQIGTCCGICCCTGKRKAIRKSHSYQVDGDRDSSVVVEEKTSRSSEPRGPATRKPLPGSFGSRFRGR